MEIKIKYKLDDDVYFIKDNKIYKDEDIEIICKCNFVNDEHEEIKITENIFLENVD